MVQCVRHSVLPRLKKDGPAVFLPLKNTKPLN
ncbi:pyrBI operon leader peptide [Salmonella enterica subsp. enterica]|nr:pyrBI operon leader peptide [Salmonella enterica subsp. enterica]